MQRSGSQKAIERWPCQGWSHASDTANLYRSGHLASVPEPELPEWTSVPVPEPVSDRVAAARQKNHDAVRVRTHFDADVRGVEQEPGRTAPGFEGGVEFPGHH